MHFNLNKRVLASSFAAMSIVATGLTAIPKGNCEKEQPQICCENPKPGPFAFSYPQDLGLSCPRDFSIHVDGLALQAKEDGLALAISDTSSSVQPGAPIQNGRVIGFSGDKSGWDYNPGVRAGFGFFTDHDAWAVDFDWTWVNITNYKHGRASTPGGGLIPLWLLGNDTPAQAGTGSGNQLNLFGADVNASWNASYNVVDLGVGKPFYISRYVILNPHFGIRGGCIDQHLSVNYAGRKGDDFANSQTIHKGENKFTGVGLRGGFKSDWIVGKGWNLFANLSGSLLSGKFEVNQKMDLPGSNGDGYTVDDDFYQNVPNMEMAVGIAWNKYFDKNKYRVGLKASYEFMQWWDQLNMRKFFTGNQIGNSQMGYANDTVSRGNLSLNGFSLSLQIDI